ncbi:MAG: ERF family protein [Clostridia bacterium]|nr:ERF family protein [Clostridia bacterium]
MNVYQKIIEVKKVVKNFLKDAETSGKGSYTYTSGSQILSAIKEKMEEIGLLFLPVETVHRGWTTFNYKNSYGDDKTDFIVEGELFYEWINADEPTDRQRVSFEYYGQQNDISKAFGSALTYSERYLLLKSLGAPTDEDDPDKHTDDKKQRQTTTPPPTQRPQNAPQERREKSKWAQVNDLIKNSEITLASVNEWIAKSFGKAIKINNLTDEQFNKLMTALRKKIEGEMNE